MKEKTNDLMKSINLNNVERDGYATETDKIVCPYCGEQWDMTYDDYEDAPYEGYEEQCSECEEYFLLDCEPETTFHFSSYRRKESGGMTREDASKNLDAAISEIQYSIKTKHSKSEIEHEHYLRNAIRFIEEAKELMKEVAE